MPTKEWFQENPKISAYISKSLHQELVSWMERRGIKKVSQALTQILEEHLEVVQSNPNEPTLSLKRFEILEEKVESLFQEIRELKRVCDEGKSRLTVEQSRKIKNTASHPVTSADNTRQLLTTGEAYEVLRNKGFDKSINTFRRSLSGALKNGALPELLTQYGLIADFEVRQSANPKDNSVRWLFLK